MASSLRHDRRLTSHRIQSLSSADGLAEFFAYLRYPADARLEMTPDALQLPRQLKDVTRRVERLTSVDAGALQIYLFELTSVTVAHTRALARAFRNRAGNFLLVLTDDYERIDFVLLEREVPGLTEGATARRGVIVRPRVLSVDRRDPDRVALRVLRRFTFTEYDPEAHRDPVADAYGQWEKLKSAYTIAEWSEPLFNNRALFSDYYLNERLPDHPAWDAEGRNRAFRAVRKTFAGARQRFAGEDASTIRRELIHPLLKTLGFRVHSSPALDPDDRAQGLDRAGSHTPSPPREEARAHGLDRAKSRTPSPPWGEGRGEGGVATADFLLYPDGDDDPAAFVLAYPWNRYLDGKDDRRDDERPEENPTAQAVSLLEAGAADWGIVTNGKIWRLYSKRAHSRATNTYEVNLEEALASPDPGEPFRYFYLFFRAEAFAPEERPLAGEIRELTFLDWLMEESQTYARELGERLKGRVFEEIFPHFAEGFIRSLGGPQKLLALPQEDREAELQRVYRGTLTFLYRLLFLLYAESRDLLPVREVRGYYQISLRRLSEEIAEQAGPLEDQVGDRLERAYPLPRHSDFIANASEGPREQAQRPERAEESRLYNRLLHLFRVIDRGSAARNVPVYNGGLFITDPHDDDASREAEAARFLEETQLPDRYLALGLDRLARDVDSKRGDLGFIDFKSLGVRQLGSIYEGLLEFNIEIAEADAVDRPSSADANPPVVRLMSDKGERKATGSYYTPEYIVEYIVRHTVGPVLDEKLDQLRPRLQEAEQRFQRVVRRKVELEGVTPDEPGILQDQAGDVLHDLFGVKILDPAMGSGHFLVEAADYVTDRLVRFLDGFPFLGVFFEGMRRSILREMERQRVSVDPSQLTDVTLLKRHVLKRCIYGVDLNPMAVELAKVSLWLDCFTLGAPLSFLDHHLRWGNSLIGAMAREVEEEMGGATADGQMTFLTGPFVGLLRATDLMQTLAGIADVTLEQVRESQSLFSDFEEKARPYKRLLDIHVAHHFGVKRAREFLALHGAEAVRARPEELEKPYREVVERTRELYEEKRFFHWDLEFPEVFIDLERAAWREEGGFDAVVGNPPYDVVEKERLGSDDPHAGLRHYLRRTQFFEPATGGKQNLFRPFLIVVANLVHSTGSFGQIVPLALLTDSSCAATLESLLSTRRNFEIQAFPQKDDATNRVFPEAKLSTCVVVGKGTKKGAVISVQTNPGRMIVREAKHYSTTYDQLSKVSHEGVSIPLASEAEWELIRRMRLDNQMIHLDDIVELSRGEINQTVYRDYITDDPSCEEMLKGSEVGFYEEQKPSQGSKEWFNSGLYERETGRRKTPPLFRIALQRITGVDDARRLTGTIAQRRVHFADSLNSVTSQDIEELRFVLALLNSRLLNWSFRVFSTNNNVSIGELRELPVVPVTSAPRVRDPHVSLARLTSLYESLQTDVVLTEIEELLSEGSGYIAHDLLAYLAKRMMAMHEEKQERVEAFWDDLEAACESPGTFKDLHERGKWEQSLWKDPACRPYVERESRSTRHLHESLAWDGACYEAFAGMLAGRTSVTPPMIDVYRRHHAPYKALVERIQSTDDLIDQIVYRLYGLTEEEIAVVEGR